MNQSTKIMRENNNLFGLIFLIAIAMPAVCIADDFYVEQQVEQLQKEVATIRLIVTQMASEIKLLKMKLKELSNQPASDIKEGSESVSSESVSTGQSWIVKISNVSTADTSSKSRMIHEEKQKIKSLETRLDHHNKSLQKLVHTESNHLIYDREKAAAAVRKQIKKTQADIRLLESKATSSNNRIRRLLREIEDLKRHVEIQGMTDEGKSVLINKTGSLSGISKSLRRGAWYQINGKGRMVGGIIRITMTGFTETEKPAVE